MSPYTLVADSDLASYVDDERFSQKFEIPLEPGQVKPFIVTYSDFGYRDRTNPQNERVLLFCSPLFGSRFVAITKDQLARDHHVRIICPDRPGFGGTTDVPVADRVATWLKIVPALLSHLSIEHVSIAAHSGGTIYAFNTLLYLRHILHPSKPYVALCAPWVHPSHSGAPLMKFVHNLPMFLLNRFDTAVGFVNSRVQPVLGFSSGLRSGSSTDSRGSLRKRYPLMSEADISACLFEEQIAPKIVARVHMENLHGLNSDAVLLLKRAGIADVWGSWIDLDGYVPLLAELEENPDGTYAPLTLDVFFAEKDKMIGNGPGPKWFEDCWRRERRGSRIEYSSSVVEGTEHDNIFDPEFGLARQIFTRLPDAVSNHV